MKKNNKKGFTLVELVIVVAVMAVLVAVAVPTVSSITGTAKNTVTETNCRTLESVLKLAEAEAAKTGDGTGTLTSTTAVKTAVDNAKLGIKGASASEPAVFYYNNTDGVVSTGTKPTLAAGSTGKVFTLSFANTGVLTVSDD